MKAKILELLSEHGVFAEPEVIDYLAARDSPLDYCTRILKAEEEPPLFLNMETVKLLEEVLRKRSGERSPEDEPSGLDEKGQPLARTSNIMSSPATASTQPELEAKATTTAPEAPKTTAEEPVILPRPGLGLLAPGFRPMALDLEADIRVLQDITNNSTCEGDIKDFTSYFKSRFNKVRRLLKARAEFRSVASISYIKENKQKGEIKVVGMVSEVRTAPWGGIIIKVEDDTAEMDATLGKDEFVVKDEVLGLVGKLDENRMSLRVKSIIRPELTTMRSPKRSREPVNVLFLSDMHVGSKAFLKKEWRLFIRWLNGHIDSSKNLASGVKYMVISGDLVDGIGIYPGQEEELEIKDIYAQYEEVARQLGDVPSHINIIVLPGNHDAVRPAEPQPTFPKEITKLFPKNCTFVGNPCAFTLHGVEVLAYHGRSIDDLIPAMKLKYDEPAEVMKWMLNMRHLAPIYGDRTPLAPEKDDLMVIERVPDIFVTGHIHKTDVKTYRSVLLIQASAWQSQTPFQKMMNLVPDPAKVVVVDLQNLNTKVLNFSG
jgi:DNA polymerase II small subunit